jgi:glycosyltransferase involved in cell wall biosynthesis
MHQNNIVIRVKKPPMKQKIAIFHNLPGGGGLRMLRGIIERYQGKFQIDIYSISDLKLNPIKGTTNNHICVKPWKGFFLYNLWILMKLPIIHKNLAIEINKHNYKLMIVTHDYFTKSPYLLRYVKIDNVYICNEPQREFYEPWKIHAPSFKEKVATLLRMYIKIIDEYNVKKANTIICNSKYTQKVINRVYHRNSDLVYPGVDEKYFKPDRPKREKIILCVGGINPIKGQLFLVNALRPILDHYRLILIGDGEREYINKLYGGNKGGGSIEIIKEIPDDKLRSLYQKASVTCISAHNEPFGLSSIESQACGTPVVSVSEGGPVESIVNGKTGYLSKRNSKEFLNKVLHAIKRQNEMGKHARENVINNWTWNVTLKKFDKYLK